MKTQNKIIIFLAFVTIIITSIIIGRSIISKKIETAVAAQKRAPVGVIATQIKYFSFYDQIDTFGTAIANQSFSIRIKKENLIQSVNFDQYPFVKKNEVIAKLSINIHQISVYIFIAVLVLHVLASLFHHFILKDKTLRRMWYGSSD